jgi:AraC-like DNA-binding protein
MLGLRIKVDATIVGEIVLDSDDSYHNYKPLPKGIYSAALDNNMLDAIVRLLKSLSSSSESKFLGPMIVREIIYRVLCNKKAEALRALAFRNQNFFKIARILDKIHEFFNKKFDLNKLAREAGMSISSFHATFKSVTNSSFLQYIKNVKLHKARLLMIEKGVNAYNAAYSVGYESPSQFNREYKRLFGITPGKEITV